MVYRLKKKKELEYMISPFLALTAPSPPHPFLSLPKHTKASKMCLVTEKDGNKIEESFQVLS